MDTLVHEYGSAIVKVVVVAALVVILGLVLSSNSDVHNAFKAIITKLRTVGGVAGLIM